MISRFALTSLPLLLVSSPPTHNLRLALVTALGAGILFSGELRSSGEELLFSKLPTMRTGDFNIGDSLT